jgi:hypothetical protein
MAHNKKLKEVQMLANSRKSFLKIKTNGDIIKYNKVSYGLHSLKYHRKR